MDLPLFGRVVWRFKFLVAGGMLLAIGLSFLSVAKVGPGGVQFRQAQVWADDVTLLVSPKGFPWGSVSPSQSADPATFGSLATIYANLATSEAAPGEAPAEAAPAEAAPEAAPEGGEEGGLEALCKIDPDSCPHVDFAKEPMIATVVPYSYQSSNSPPLPFITMEAQAATKERVVELVRRESNAFLQYLHTLQAADQIPPDKRAQVTIVKGDQIRLLKPRSKTVPIMILMLVMTITFGLAFLLENLRPRVRLVHSDGGDADLVLARRTA